MPKPRPIAALAPRPPWPSGISGADYADGFSIPLVSSASIKSLTLAFLASAPPWVDRLLALRDWLVAWAGLKTAPMTAELTEADLVPGAELGLFTCYWCGPSEVVMGQKDRHLDFYTSLKASESGDGAQLDVVTWVYYHNLWGRIYFFLVGPLHRRVVCAMLMRMP